MASSREILQPARSLTHRPSMSPSASSMAGSSGLSSSPANGLANRQSHARTGSHSIIGAALNPNHRVTRRKSMTGSGATNVAAVAAMIQEAEAIPVGAVEAMGGAVRRNAMASKVVAGAGVGMGVGSGSLGSMGSLGSLGSLPRQSAMAAALAASAAGVPLGFMPMGGRPLPSPPASLPTRKFMTADGSAIDDDLNDMSDGEVDLSGIHGTASPDAERFRRSSDGQPLAKDGQGRRASTRMDLRCNKCGKGYKHSSCLTKHLWEHTPEWNLTSKLLISKHQQVQLLEAASVLVAMNNPLAPHNDTVLVSTPPESTKDFASDQGSPSSPVGSGYSDRIDDRSSVNTTPPPPSEVGMVIEGGKREPSVFSQLSVQSPDSHNFSQRYGATSSFQSDISGISGTTANGSVLGGGIALAHQLQAGQTSIVRPMSSGRNVTGKEDTELAAAVEMLSCSFNSNGGDSRAVVGSLHGGLAGQDVPPVPPVPVQYLGHTQTPLDDTSFINSFPTKAPESFTRGERHHSSVEYDVNMEEDSPSPVEDDDIRSRWRSDDDDDGVFGRMEE